MRTAAHHQVEPNGADVAQGGQRLKRGLVDDQVWVGWVDGGQQGRGFARGLVGFAQLARTQSARRPAAAFTRHGACCRAARGRAAVGPAAGPAVGAAALRAAGSPPGTSVMRLNPSRSSSRGWPITTREMPAFGRRCQWGRAEEATGVPAPRVRLWMGEAWTYLRNSLRSCTPSCFALAPACALTQAAQRLEARRAGQVEVVDQRHLTADRLGQGRACVFAHACVCVCVRVCVCECVCVCVCVCVCWAPLTRAGASSRGMQ